MEQTDVRLMYGGFCPAKCDWTRREWVKEPYHKLYFPTGGTATYSVRAVGGKEVETVLSPGRIYFVPAHTEQRHVCSHWMDLHWLHFTTDSLVLDRRLAQLAMQDWSAEEWRVWYDDYTHMTDFFSKPSVSMEMRLHGMLLCFVSSLIERMPETDATERATERFARAIQFMDNNFAKSPRLEEIAAQVHLSPIYFHRAFSETFQATPHEYMLRRRMDLAYRLVVNTDRKISDIADTCGYESPFYFSRVFKSYFRLSPRFLRMSKDPPAVLGARLTR